MATLDVPSAIAVVSAVSDESLIVPCSFFVPYIPDTCSICGRAYCAHLGGDGVKDSYFNKFANPSLIILPESKILKCPPLVTYS